MSSDNQYTALGPAAVGFQTDGASIAKGAEVAGTQLGVQGTGPVGVPGRGQGGPGRKFTSDGNLDAQIHVQPYPMANPGVAVNVEPRSSPRSPRCPCRAGPVTSTSAPSPSPSRPAPDHSLCPVAVRLQFGVAGPAGGGREPGSAGQPGSRSRRGPVGPRRRLPLGARFSPAQEHHGLPGRPFAVARQPAAAEPGEDLRDVLPEAGRRPQSERDRHGPAVVPAEQRLDVRPGTHYLTRPGQDDRPEAGDKAF